jgi:hypothetical protein
MCGLSALVAHPDIYDQIKHDAVHNLSLELTDIPELYRLSKAFGEWVCIDEAVD